MGFSGWDVLARGNPYPKPGRSRTAVHPTEQVSTAKFTARIEVPTIITSAARLGPGRGHDGPPNRRLLRSSIQYDNFIPNSMRRLPPLKICGLRKVPAGTLVRLV